MALEKVGSPVFTGASTGERLKDQRPDLYRIVVQLLGQGSGVREIMRITGLHNKTIAAVREREGVSIDTLKKVHAAGHSMVVELGIELTEEAFTQGTIHGEPVKLKLGDIAMATKLHFDMKQILTGGVTARVEKIEQSQVAAGLERMLDDLPVIDAEWEAEEVTGTNPVPENTQTIAALLDASDAGLDASDAAPLPVDPVDPAGNGVLASEQFTAASDGQSDAYLVSDSVVAETATSIATSKASKSPRKTPAAKSKGKVSKEGGRGSAKSLNPKNPD